MPFHLRPRYFGGSPTAPGARITPMFEGWTRGQWRFTALWAKGVACSEAGCEVKGTGAR